MAGAAAGPGSAAPAGSVGPRDGTMRGWGGHRPPGPLLLLVLLLWVLLGAGHGAVITGVSGTDGTRRAGSGDGTGGLSARRGVGLPREGMPGCRGSLCPQPGVCRSAVGTGV